MQGVSKNKNFTGTGHCFVLINDGTNWLIIDSYIGKRELSYKIVDIDNFKKLISKMDKVFTDDLWLELTGCKNEDTNTTRISTLTAEYDFSFTNINKQFIKIVDRAKKRLNEEYIGTDDSYLSLLSSNLNINEANTYLDSLYSHCNQ